MNEPSPHQPYRQLGIFAKFWEPGLVKTRLASEIGKQAAADFYLASLRTLVYRFADLGDRRHLMYWPPERIHDFRELAGDRWEVSGQIAGDLGVRMLEYFRAAFAATADHGGSSRVVLIGSDSPNLPAERIEQAFAALNDHEVVLGPSEDGGYYLVGMSRLVPELFEEVVWSSPDVWQQSLDNLNAAGVHWHELPKWFDVDEVNDLSRLRSELHQSVEDCPHLARLRRATETALNAG